jgi:hypothetical protein
MDSLGVELQPQEQTYWCWAAVVASIVAFFDPRDTATQCAVANAVLRRRTCCESGSSSDCNAEASLGRALDEAGHLAEVHRTAEFANLQREIDAKRPMCGRIEWERGQGHFLVIDGFQQGAPEIVHVQDPLAAASPRWLPLDELRFRYRRQGKVTHVYETKHHDEST